MLVDMQCDAKIIFDKLDEQQSKIECKSKKEANKVKHDSYNKAIIAAPSITRSSYEELMKKGVYTTDDTWRISICWNPNWQQALIVWVTLTKLRLWTYVVGIKMTLKKIEKWNVVRGKDGYYRAYKRIYGSVVSIHLGINIYDCKFNPLKSVIIKLHRQEQIIEISKRGSQKLDKPKIYNALKMTVNYAVLGVTSSSL